MIGGVDLVKLALFNALKKSFLKQHPAMEISVSSLLAASGVNEIFGCHDNQTLSVYNSNTEVIDSLIRDTINFDSDLKKILTDAIRAYVLSMQILGSKEFQDSNSIMSFYQQRFDKGIVNKGGESPKMESFLQSSQAISQKYLKK